MKRSYYHITPLSNLKSILSTGLTPRVCSILPDESIRHELAGKPVVYLSIGAETALEVYEQQKEEGLREGLYVMLKARVEQASLVVDTDCHGDSFMSSKGIPARDISVAWIEGYNLDEIDDRDYAVWSLENLQKAGLI